MPVLAGADIGGTKILARLIDPVTGDAAGRVKRSTPVGSTHDLLEATVEVIRELEADMATTIDAVGVGVPGPVTAAGVAGPCPNIAGWEQPWRLAEDLSARLGKPVAVGNDVDLGTLAEHRLGAAAGAANALGVFVGTGVGGGLVLDGRLVRSARGLVGEIGHLVVEGGGEPCGCGGVGHLEAYAGRAGMTRRALALPEAACSDPDLGLLDAAAAGRIKSRVLARSLAAEDPLALRLLGDAADALAQAIAGLAVVLDLDVVVLGGGVADRIGDWLIERIQASPSYSTFAGHRPSLVLAERLDDAGVWGAALLAGELV